MELGDTLRELAILLLSYDPWVLNAREQHTYPIALIRMNLETGLKHQLRLQASKELRGIVITVLLATVLSYSRLAPILGDPLHSPRSMPRLGLHLHPGRIFLHATSLTLVVSCPVRKCAWHLSNIRGMRHYP